MRDPMTKAKLLKLLEPYPDDMEVIMRVDDEDANYFSIFEIGSVTCDAGCTETEVIILEGGHSEPEPMSEEDLDLHRQKMLDYHKRES